MISGLLCLMVRFVEGVDAFEKRVHGGGELRCGGKDKVEK